MINTFYSEEYLNLLKLEHEKGLWGNVGGTIFNRIDEIAKEYSFSSILDYGSGHGSLIKALNKHLPGKYNVIEYDPGVEGKTLIPNPCEFVVCIDVLEHIEKQFVDNVLNDLQRCVENVGFFTIALTPAVRRLSDGSNAHVTVESFEWWDEKIRERFAVIKSYSDEEKAEYIVSKNKI